MGRLALICAERSRNMGAQKHNLTSVEVVGMEFGMLAGDTGFNYLYECAT